MASVLRHSASQEVPALEFRLSARYDQTEVLRDVTGTIWRGEIVSLVGLSGSGKSTLALALLGLLRYRGGTVDGSIRLCGEEIIRSNERDLRSIRGRLAAYVPQNAAAALNPRVRVRSLLEETWRAHRREEPEPDFWRELLGSVQLPASRDFLDRRAGQLSTGQGQRLLIALAIMHDPPLLIADEPTSALDAITQAAILELFRNLSRTRNLGLLFISHDLLSVSSLSNRVSILHQGRIVETGTPEKIFTAPDHPFTRKLVAAAPARPVQLEPANGA